MEDTQNFLELRAGYQSVIRELRSVREEEIGILPEHLSPQLSLQDIRHYSKKRRINSYINNLQLACHRLAVRIGQEPDKEWLAHLTKEEKKVFILRYKHQLDYTDIAEVTELQPRIVHNIFKSAVQKVLRTIIGIGG